MSVNKSIHNQITVPSSIDVEGAISLWARHVQEISARHDEIHALDVLSGIAKSSMIDIQNQMMLLNLLKNKRHNMFEQRAMTILGE